LKGEIEQASRRSSTRVPVIKRGRKVLWREQELSALCKNAAKIEKKGRKQAGLS
jgi:hypothetical protein